MKEKISKIEVSADNELCVFLTSGGKSSYEMIYRRSEKVYWDINRKCFYSPTESKGSISERLHHILSVTQDCKINLVITDETKWVNVTLKEKGEINDK